MAIDDLISELERRRAPPTATCQTHRALSPTLPAYPFYEPLNKAVWAQLLSTPWFKPSLHYRVNAIGYTHDRTIQYYTVKCQHDINGLSYYSTSPSGSLYYLDPLNI